MKRLCTICVRAGSKGVPNKNIRFLAGRPLLVYTLEQAKETQLFDAVAVSSDGSNILNVATQFGADFAIGRPPSLASDDAPKLPAIRHCVEMVESEVGTEFDIIVDLDATSPLRSKQDIVGAVRLLENEGVDNVITGSTARRSPYFNMVELDPDDGSVQLVKTPGHTISRRQDAPKCFDMNASIYVWKRSALFSNKSLFGESTRLFEMPEERSLDIDSQLDFEIVEFLMNRNAKR